MKDANGSKNNNKLNDKNIICNRCKKKGHKKFPHINLKFYQKEKFKNRNYKI